jgi:predicted Zn-dependent protease
VLRVVPARPGDSVSGYAARLPFQEKAEERFRVINGLAPGQALQAGQLLKVITAR